MLEAEAVLVKDQQVLQEFKVEQEDLAVEVMEVHQVQVILLD